MAYHNDPDLGPVRSPLRLRLVLAILGVIFSVGGVIVMLVASHPGWAFAFGAIAVIAIVDVGVISARLAQDRRSPTGRK